MKKFIPTLPELFVWIAIVLLVCALAHQPTSSEAIRNGNQLRKHRAISQPINK